MNESWWRTPGETSPGKRFAIGKSIQPNRHPFPVFDMSTIISPPLAPATRLLSAGNRTAAIAAMAVLSLALHAQVVTQPTFAPDTDRPPPTVTTAAAAETEDDDIVELSPFTVTASEDKGYLAQNSLSGSRLNTSLKDIATPTSSFTEQFMEDLMINNIDDLAQYMLSTEYSYNEDSGNNNQNNSTGIGKALRVRGFAVSQTIDFFTTSHNTDRFSIDRIDQVRGPSSVLFGVGNPGGIINSTIKRAKLNRASGYVKLQAQSYDGIRYELDYNQPLIKNKLGFRVAAVKSQQESWRNYDSTDQARYFGTIKWMLGPKTEINVEGETGRIEKMTNRNIIGLDGITTWMDEGRQFSATPDESKQVQLINGGTAAANWMVLDTSTGQLMNWRGKTASMQRETAGGEYIPLNVDGKGNYYDYLPRETSVYGPGWGTNYKYSRLSANFTHAFTKDLFFEVSAMRTIVHNTVDDPQQAVGRFIQADTNETLPDGSPNPNVGRPYIESYGQSNRNNTMDQAIRAMVTYTKNLKNLGRHTMAGAFIYNEGTRNQRMLRENIVSPNAPQTGDVTNNQNRIWRRTYLGRQLDDGTWTLTGVPSNNIVMADWRKHPIAEIEDKTNSTATWNTGGRTYRTEWIPFNNSTQINSFDGTSTIGMLQSSFLKNRVKTIIGASYDTRTDYLSDDPTKEENRTPLPGFTYGIPHVTPSNIGQSLHGRSLLGSVIWHVTDWMSLAYNKAENNGLPDFSGRVWSTYTVTLDNGETAERMRQDARPPVSRGKSDDISVKFDLFNRRVFATLTWFKTAVDDDFMYHTIPNRNENLNAIWNALQSALVTGGVTRAPLDQYGYSSYSDLLDASTGRTFKSRTKGIEFELIANPTDNMKLRVIYSYQITTNHDIGPEMLAYLNRWIPFWESTGDWEGYPSLMNIPLVGNNSGRTFKSAVDTVKRAMNDEYILADGREPVGQMRHKLAANATYDFTTGVLRGVSIGGTAKYNSKPVTGFDVWSEPVLDPVTNDPVIDPATGDKIYNNMRSERWGLDSYTVDLQLGYKRKIALFGKSYMWSVRLHVNNLFNDDKVYPLRVARDGGGTLTMYKFSDPRSIQIMTQLKF